ncbi:PPE family protein [Mycobacterium shimoidei]|uniref:PPE family protein n=1 Tax=Mycobacterium shimoidei TaxID=29313 RepID=UPI000848C3CA|nr:PPE family protein [Mycobacterium shimoidei]MCV7259002.1 PPE family protein [Mycobacterium shimoidei]ODR11618.1 hypothetical protein BHQ16_18130 [Mycobacterium shimoidei]ORW76837.1 hypothetical protein AWC26_20160 [Mycobacterium shimoidei]
MDFGALPPEINSALMYAGDGSTSLQAAASAWNGLAAELNSAALGYEKVLTQLSSEEWLGPASASMVNAAAPYVAWLNATAAQAEQAATQARAAAAAYEQAFAATVPPQLVVANRAQTAQLVSTNVLGQNTPAITQLEAAYAEMWAQDAAAMYGYAAQSAAATNVTPFSAPTQIANPAGQAAQAAAVTQAAGTAAGTSTQSTLSDLMSSLQGLLTGLGSPTSSAASFPTFPSDSVVGSILSGIGGSTTLNPAWFITAFRNFAGPIYNIEGLPYFSTGMANTMLSISKALTPAAAKAAEGAAGAAGAAGGLGGLGGLLGGGGGAPISAALGGAGSVGKLSVPPVWTGAGAPPVASPAAPLPISSVSAAPDNGAGAGSLLGGMPLAGAGAGAGGAGPRYGFRPTVMTRPPFAG